MYTAYVCISIAWSYDFAICLFCFIHFPFNNFVSFVSFFFVGSIQVAPLLWYVCVFKVLFHWFCIWKTTSKIHAKIAQQSSAFNIISYDLDTEKKTRIFSLFMVLICFNNLVYYGCNCFCFSFPTWIFGRSQSQHGLFYKDCRTNH